MNIVNLKKPAGLFFSALLIFSLTACSDNDGVFEEAGEELDNAVQDTSDALEDGGNEAADRLEDACEELTEENC